jgi:hypothetical protein
MLSRAILLGAVGALLVAVAIAAVALDPPSAAAKRPRPTPTAADPGVTKTAPSRTLSPTSAPSRTATRTPTATPTDTPTPTPTDTMTATTTATGTPSPTATVTREVPSGGGGSLEGVGDIDLGGDDAPAAPPAPDAIAPPAPSFGGVRIQLSPTRAPGRIAATATPPTPTPTPIRQVLAEVAAPKPPSPGLSPVAAASPVAANARPDMLLSLPIPGELSLDSGVVATNFSLMAITLLALLLSSALFNATLSENRDELEALLGRAARGVAPLWSVSAGAASRLGGRAPFLSAAAGPLAVLALTAVIYGFADPGFGFNQQSVIVALSVLVCVTATTYLSEGGEAFIARFRYGQSTSLRAFPFAVGIAAASVGFSRLAGLEPAIIYGFVGTAVFLRPSTMTVEEAGKTAFIPSLVLLGVSLGAWFLVIPFRALNDHTSAAAPEFLESLAAGIFIVGLQSLFFNMIPLSFMDGEKIWKWNKSLWLAMAGVATLLFWYVFLNRDGAGVAVFSDTASLSVLGALAGLLALSFATWGFFRTRALRAA